MRDATKFYTGLDGAFYTMVGCYKRWSFSLTRLRKQALIAHEYSLSSTEKTEQQLTAEILTLRKPTRGAGTGDTEYLLMGILCEICHRIMGMRPYVEQIMGALAMNQNVAIQMQTGEGKTITAALAAVMAGWRGGPCHVVTSNDYLAKRDAELMAPLFTRCGLTVGAVISGMVSPERRATYNKDVVYSTSKELLADFLRDRMAEHEEASISCDRIRAILTNGADSGKVMRGIHTAIIDEADSVLVDEATVPLIIAIPGGNPLLNDAVRSAFKLSEQLESGKDYILNEQAKYVTFTESGNSFIERMAIELPAAWRHFDRSSYLVKQAIIARFCYHRDVHYVVDKEKVVIVDEKTGRMMDGRSWNGGLHQAVEVKENVENSDPTHAHIKMSFQMFFRMYTNLSGMSGTLQNVEKELWTVYNLPVVRIPTHAPKQLISYPEIVCKTVDEKWNAIIDNVKLHSTGGKAVLIGVRSVKDSEQLYTRLLDSGFYATVLNALRHEEEAIIISGAGRQAQITIATNMAGRGTDIRVEPEVLAAGGLHVIATERHESRRVDMQLFGRTARQGVPGSAQMIVSLEDEIIKLFSPRYLKPLLSFFADYGQKMNPIVIWFQVVQYHAEKTISRVRKKLLEQDLALSKALSFTKY